MKERRRPLALAAGLAAVAAGLTAASFAACSSPPPVATGGDFVAPTGLAIASGADRDLLFISNAGTSDLRAINICNTPTDGGSGPAPTTCPASQDFRFVPGPIRIFPASLPVATRPIRLAGLKLVQAGFAADGGSVDAGPPGALADGGVAPIFGGAALVAGAEPSLYVVDTNTIIATEYGTSKTVTPPVRLALPAQPIDVIAADRPGARVRAFALTLGEDVAAGAQIVALTASLDQTGTAQVQIDARCALPIVPTRLALVPGRDDLLYVGDGSPDGIPGGKGDGALELRVADILALGTGGGADAGFPPPAACPAGRRIAATDNLTNPGSPRARPLAALALNPEVVGDVHASDAGPNGFACPDGGSAPTDGGDLCDPTIIYPAGAMILGVTAAPGSALDTTNPNVGREAGRLVFLRTAAADVSPRPPHNFFEGPQGLADGGTSAAPPQMQPLAVNGLAREVTFLQPPGREKCPVDSKTGLQHDRPCNLVVVGNRQTFATLVAAATSSDGATYFLDADKRRFFNDARDETKFPNLLGPSPALETAPTLTPTAGPGVTPPVLTLAPGDKDLNGDQLRPDGWFTAGVSRHATWRAVFHAQIPGLEKVGAVISRRANADGTTAGYRLTLPGLDLTRFTALAASCGVPGKYCLGLGVGDLVSFQTFTSPAGQLCPELATENNLPPRELPITSIAAVDAHTLDIGLEAVAPPAGRFDPNPACFPDPSQPGAVGTGVTVELRVGDGLGGRPWLVYEANELRGRLKYDEQFIGYEPRFDYPLEAPPRGDLDASAFSQDVGASFTISKPADGSDPPPKASFFFTVNSGQGQTQVRDTASFPGLAGPVLVYNSPKVTNLVFTAVTGANSVLQIDPALIGIVNGIIAYR